jgi:hypothetical protein
VSLPTRQAGRPPVTAAGQRAGIVSIDTDHDAWLFPLPRRFQARCCALGTCGQFWITHDALLPQVRAG